MIYIVRLFWEEPELYQFLVEADDKATAEELAARWLQEREIWVRGEYPDDEIHAYPLIIPDKDIPVVPIV